MLITQFTFKHAIQNILVQDRTKDQPHDKSGMENERILLLTQ